MADFELSCGLPPSPDFAELAVLAEQLGYARVWIFDSAPLWEDPFVHLALRRRADDADRSRQCGARPDATLRDGDGVRDRDASPGSPAAASEPASGPASPRASRWGSGR